jgi:hypothetical protein
MGIIDNLFGGGQEEANNIRSDAYGEAQKGYAPFRDAGVSSLKRYQDALGRMQDPGSFYESIMSNYNRSPSAQRRLRQGLDVLENEGAASGFMNSGPMRKEITDYTQDVIGSDEQRYLQNILGIWGGYLGGEGGLTDMGVNTTGALSNLILGRGEADAKAAEAESEGMTNFLSNIAQMAADYYTGGMSSVIKPFTSSFNRAPQGGGGGNGNMGNGIPQQPLSRNGGVFNNFFTRRAA